MEFEATSDAYPILGGTGHVDRLYGSEPVDGAPFEGFTLRLFDPQSRTWRIWWSSTRVPGVLDTPVEGRITDGRGVFECDDEVGGRQVRVRFERLKDDPDAPQWQQAFSYDSGSTWQLNWIMRLTRAIPAG